MVKHFFFDLETTGLDPELCGIHQISARVYVDYVKKFEFNVHVRPFPNDKIDEKALAIAGKTMEDLKQPNHYGATAVYKSLMGMLPNFVNKYDKTDKLHLIGFNNLSFDNPFFRNFFKKNGDQYFDSWFFSGLDVFSLAAQHLADIRHEMPDFNLATVADKLGFGVEEHLLHDSYYDLALTESIFTAVTGKQLLAKKLDLV